MKKYLIFAILLQICFVVSAQKEISDETNSEAIPFSEIHHDGNYMNFTVKEKYSGEFEENPVRFLNTYFDASKYFENVSDKKITGLDMIFKTSKGSLKAHLNRNGDIVKTFHKCKNVLVPRDVSEELYRKHKGWAMVENTHIAKGRSGKIDKEFFKVKMVKNGKVKRVKISLNKTNKDGIAGH